MKKIILVCIAAVLISAVFYGCTGNSSDKSSKSSSDNSGGKTKTTVSTTDSSIKVKDNKGNEVQSGGDIAWPSDIPSDVPKWEGKLKASYHSDSVGSSVQFSTNHDQLKAYVEKIKAAGYVVVVEADTEDGFSVELKKNNWSVCVTLVGSDPDDQYGQLLYCKYESGNS